MVDTIHLDQCSGRYCKVYALRCDLSRIKGRRGYFCDRCVSLYTPKVEK
jgi:hypothetical protein